MQTPPVQLQMPPVSAAQRRPHMPQLFRFVSRLTHVPPQLLRHAPPMHS